MWTRWFLPLVVVAAAGMVGGCGDDEGAGGDAGSGDAPAEVTIGAFLPLTGVAATYGEWMRDATKLAVEDINAKGGIAGKTKIKMVTEDTKGLPEDAVVAFRRVTGQNDIPYGITALSSQSLALAPIAEQQKITLINGGAQGNELGEASPYLFNDIPLIKNEATLLTKYLVEDADFKEAAIIHTDDDGGKSAAQSLKEGFEAAGGRIVGQQSAKFNGTEFRSQLTKLRNTGAPLLLIGAYGQDSQNILTQLREVGWDVQTANTSWVVIPEVLKNPGARGLIHTTVPFDPPQEFQDRWKQKYGYEPASHFIGNYYDAVTVFATAYERALSEGEPDGEAIRDAILATKEFDSVYGTPLVFSGTGVGERPINIAKVTDGKSEVLVENYK